MLQLVCLSKENASLKFTTLKYLPSCFQGGKHKIDAVYLAFPYFVASCYICRLFKREGGTAEQGAGA